MSNGFQEPQPFSIDEGLLEKTLLAIGNTPPVTASKKENYQDNFANKSEGIFAGIPSFMLDEIKEKTKIYVKKLIINSVIKNSNKTEQVDCEFGSDINCILCNHNGIIYKVQGKWSGSEVIILDESNEKLLVARSMDGSDWENVTDKFIIKKQ